MAEYFLCLNAETFLHRLRPALAASWRLRNFDPCRSLCQQLLPAVHEYSTRYHLGAEETLVAQVAEGIPFDRAFWRHLVGEVLLFAAVEIPEFQSNAPTLYCLLAPEQYRQGTTAREQYAPIHQVLQGSRDVTFGSAVYRPEQAGYNGSDDVAWLTSYLASIKPESWTVEELRLLRDVEYDAEREDELAFVREWFPALVDLYQRACSQRYVLVIENIY